MIRAHDNFLRALEGGVVPAPEALVDIEETDSEEAWEQLFAEGTTLRDSDFDVPRLRGAVESDRRLLEQLHRRVATVTPENDPKLVLLVERLADAARDAERGGTTEAE